MEKNKKNLLITTTTFPRFKNDSEPRFILDLAKSLNKYANVTVLAPYSKGSKEKEIMENVKVERFHYFPIREMENLTAPGAIVSRIKENKLRLFLIPFFLFAYYKRLQKMSKNFDIVQANWLIPQGIIQSFIKKVPFIVTCHGSDINTLNNSLIRKVKKMAMKKACGITYVSSELKDTANKIYKNKKEAVISMGVDTKKFGKAYYRENYFNQKDKKVILFVGRLVEVKGVSYLIEAMKDVKNAILYIVGSGDLENKLRLEAKNIKEELEKNNSQIIFAGAKNHNDLKTIYASADLFVAPSIRAKDGSKEGFGLVLIEAAASGLPIIASRIGGIKDIIKDFESGIFTKERSPKSLAKAINTVLYDENLYKKLSNNSYKLAKEYDFDNIAKKFAVFMGLI